MKKNLYKDYLKKKKIKEKYDEQVVVNEQNPQAKGFYEHMGFKVYERSEIDEQGNGVYNGGNKGTGHHSGVKM